MNLRRLVELAARNRVIRRRLPPEFAGRPLYVSPDAALRWLKPGADAFERSLVELALHWVRPGDVVWDVGANVGVFTFAAAHRSRTTVVAVEADPFLCGLLRRSAAGNRDLDVHVLGAAASAANGVAQFAIAGRGRASNGLVSGHLTTQHGQTRAVLTVPTLTLDAMLANLEPPALLKIDVEGAELLVLGGAERLMTAIRPVIYIETGRDTQERVRQILAGKGYRLFSGDGSLATPQPMGSDECNVLAVPSGRAAGGQPV